MSNQADEKERARAYIQERITETDGGCWIWSGNVSPAGTPRFTATWFGMRSPGARRVACIIYKGEEPPSKTIPKCGNQLCVNPDHSGSSRKRTLGLPYSPAEWVD